MIYPQVISSIEMDLAHCAEAIETYKRKVNSGEITSLVGELCICETKKVWSRQIFEKLTSERYEDAL